MDDPHFLEDLDLPDPAAGPVEVYFCDAATATGCRASQCVVCLKEAKDEPASEKLTWMQLWCGHWSHSACVADWFSVKKSCPLCRDDASTHVENVRREFLNARDEYNNARAIKRWADQMLKESRERERKATKLAEVMGVINRT